MTLRNSTRQKDGISLKNVGIFVLFGICCFYLGVIVGAHTVSTDKVCSKYITLEGEEEAEIDHLKRESWEPRFPKEVSDIAAGMALVHRDNFTDRFDMGVPLDPNSMHNEKVLLLYSNKNALPSIKARAHEARSNQAIPTMRNLEKATENCDTLNVILTQPNDKRQCFAMMGQFRSYHIQKFMRLPAKEGMKLDPKAPLRYVNRGAQPSGRLSAKHPSRKDTAEYWEILKNYLNSFEDVIQELRPVAKKAAEGHNNTVIVMVCNHGQSELLMNFYCSAKARDLDISGVLVFVTDEETKEMARGLGMNYFYDEINYASMPKEAAKRYADETFTSMMMAKVYCVQQVLSLGYDVLFQDVDIVWYRNPLEFFHQDPTSAMSQHEMYFQDDGSRGIFYAPYSANTGLYYVRNNARTRYFFNSLLMAGDLIKSTHSHQIALVSLLSEHASMHGLKIKVLSRDTEEFPGGFAFHNRPEFMKSLMKGEVQPYLFHMSWTANKKNKELFFRQIGNWYLKDTCVQRSAFDILQVAVEGEVEPGVLVEPCCRAKPFVMCSYKDKPSLNPCPHSPALDANGKSFW